MTVKDGHKNVSVHSAQSKSTLHGYSPMSKHSTLRRRKPLSVVLRKFPRDTNYFKRTTQFITTLKKRQVTFGTPVYCVGLSCRI